MDLHGHINNCSIVNEQQYTFIFFISLQRQSVCVASMILEHLSLGISTFTFITSSFNLVSCQAAETDQVNAKVYQRTVCQRERVSRDSDHQRFDHLPILYSSQRKHKEVLRLSAEKRAIPFLSSFLFFFFFSFSLYLCLCVSVSVRRTGHLFRYKYIAFPLLPQKERERELSFTLVKQNSVAASADQWPDCCQQISFLCIVSAHRHTG